MTDNADLKLGSQLHIYSRNDGACALGTVVKPIPDGAERVTVAEAASPGHHELLRHDPQLSRRHSSGVKFLPDGKPMADWVIRTWHRSKECPHGR